MCGAGSILFAQGFCERIALTHNKMMNDLLPSYFYISHIRIYIYSIGKIDSHNYLQGFVRRSIYFLAVMIQVEFFFFTIVYKQIISYMQLFGHQNNIQKLLPAPIIALFECSRYRVLYIVCAVWIGGFVWMVVGVIY